MSSTDRALLLGVPRLPESSLRAHVLAFAAKRGVFGLTRLTLLLISVTVVAAVGGLIGVLSRPRVSTAPASDGCGAGTSYRLPNTATPISYAVDWDISQTFAAPFTFSGTSAVDLIVARGETCVFIHARDLTISSAAVSLPSAAASRTPLSFTVDAFSYAERIILTLPSASTGEAVRLHFAFSGALSITNIGFYGSTYVNGSTTVPLVQTKFEPAFARTAFPCFDEPALKATFNVTVRGVPNGYEVLGNMPILNRVGDVAVFEPSPVMSTYQTTIVVAPMKKVSFVLPPSIPVTVFTMDRGDASLVPGCQFSGQTAVDVLSFYSTTFAIPFPLPKLDLVYLPVFPVGAMEQWGLVTYTEAYLSSGFNGSASAAGVVAHELAHQWWGNLVTASWWGQLWLQEGAATFWPNVVLPLTQSGLQYDASWGASTRAAMAEDVWDASQAVTAVVPPSSSGASYAMFGSITYDKGASVYAALRRRVEARSLGSFFSGVRSFLASRAYGSVQPSDLLSALNIIGGEFDALINSPGVPVVSVTYSTGQLTFNLSRLLGSGGIPSWVVPLSVTAQRPSNALALASVAASSALATTGGYTAAQLSGLSITWTAATDGWVAFSNGSASEYYRVSYPVEVLDSFASALSDGRGGGLSDDARAALVDDVFALAEAGAGCASCTTQAALSWAARWVNSDNSSIVFSTVSSRVSRLFSLLVDDVPPSAQGALAAMPEAAMPGTPSFACTQSLLIFARDSLGVSASTIASLNNSVANVNRTALRLSLNVPLDAVSATTVLSRVAVNGARDIAWLWAKENWSLLTSFYGFRSTLATLVRTLGRSFTSTAWADDMDTFYGAHASATPVVDGAWQRAVESARFNAAWRSGNVASLCSWLANAPQSGLRPWTDNAGRATGDAGSHSGATSDDSFIVI